MNFPFFLFFQEKNLLCREKKISLFQFIFFSVCWISISSVSTASSSHSLSRRPNKNTGGRRKCLFLAQKLVCDKHLPVFTAITLQNYSLRWSSGELGSTHTKISGMYIFFVLDTWKKKSFENVFLYYFCYWADLESLCLPQTLFQELH